MLECSDFVRYSIILKFLVFLAKSKHIDSLGLNALGACFESGLFCKEKVPVLFDEGWGCRNVFPIVYDFDINFFVTHYTFRILISENLISWIVFWLPASDGAHL